MKLNLRRKEKLLMPSESDFRRLFRKFLPQVHWATVESRATESGIPDINGCIAGSEFWLECKLTKAYAVVMRPMQIAWILRRVRHGGKVFIAVRKKNSKVDELYLIDGAYVKTLHEKGLHGIEPIGIDGPKSWSWSVVAGRLAGTVPPPVGGRFAALGPQQGQAGAGQGRAGGRGAARPPKGAGQNAPAGRAGHLAR
jgi:Holliday junction resolvase